MRALPTLALAALATLAPPARAQWPAGFSSAPVGAGWSQPTGLAFAPDGRLFVWEKAGRVWTVTNGVRSAQPVLDVSAEVGDWRDHGLLGCALDPAFLQNGRVYLLYVVDYHHLRWFGTPSYDPHANEYFRDTIGRLARYTLDLASPDLAVVHGSRTVLLGESMSSGIPICNQSHGVGSLVFGADGTLLVSCGDGASYDVVDNGGSAPGSSNTALADGILRPEENVGAFRAQLVDCLNGKVLRLDPATGDGVPSNPFFDPLVPRAPRSRVWALGLRNPFRMALQPGTGLADPAAGDPGTLWIGDVGWNAWEELDVCDAPGLDFGWPLYEGLEAHPTYAWQTTPNLTAPNPLFGGGGCGAAYFAFRDLLVQDAAGAPSWPNPCDPAQQIPSSVPRFVHRRPLVDWFHGSGPARTGVYQGGLAATALVGAPGAPVQGPQFGGACAAGGAWVSGSEFGPEFQGTLLTADYVGNWIRRVVPASGGAPAEIQPFGAGGEIAGPVALAWDPAGSGLAFIRYAAAGASEIRLVRRTTNQPPLAAAQASAAYGPVPLPVSFSSAGSLDPEGQPLAYRWEFGDGALSTLPDPVHVYDGLEDVTAQGAFVARVLELAPPHPLGGGSWDPEVLRDGDTPPAGDQDSARQYDTYHAGDQGDLDWLGWAFATPRTFRALVFQEGKHFFDGGWFDELRVEAGDGATWTPVAGATVTPPYPGNNGVSYETFRFDFAPVTATHVRLVGRPGGSAGFVSAGELRVLADGPAAAGLPLARDVVLTVTDAQGASASASLVVSLNNTPPRVTITSPLDGALYPLIGPTTVPLTASVSDLEHGPAELACAWQTVLHHNEHTHPEPVDPSCATSTQLTPEGCDGEEYHFEVHLTVTDAAGLATTRTARVWPDCVPQTFCAGDGSGTACPCGNAGGAGRGCENSFGTGGGRLAASGGARLGADSLLLTADGLPASASALFFQGAELVAGGQGAVFGDGLRCVEGDVVRLGARLAQGGVVALGPAAGDAPLSQLGGLPADGAVRCYQVWYRNVAPYCTAAAFNLTSAVRVTWIP